MEMAFEREYPKEFVLKNSILKNTREQLAPAPAPVITPAPVFESAPIVVDSSMLLAKNISVNDEEG